MFEWTDTKIDRIERKIDTLNVKIDALVRHAGIEEALIRALTKLEKQMAETTADIVAKISAQTDILRSIQTAASALAEGHASISDEIADLKAQIAAGQPPDFTAVDQAIADQSTVIGSIATAIPANTSAGGT